VSYELENFVLQLKLAGHWTTVAAGEHQAAAEILGNADAVRVMLCGAEITVESAGQKWQCRLTPKSWLA
jgi:hypothetical protein